MNCNPSYEAILKACPATIELKAGLSANTSFYWLLTIRSGKIYQRQANTDATGKLTIDCSQLPAGLLNPNAGYFTLQVRNGNDYLQTATLTFSGKTYSSVQLKFEEMDAEPANLYNVIQ